MWQKQSTDLLTKQRKRKPLKRRMKNNVTWWLYDCVFHKGFKVQTLSQTKIEWLKLPMKLWLTNIEHQQSPTFF